jgi:hypothetical protein
LLGAFRADDWRKYQPARKPRGALLDGFRNQILRPKSRVTHLESIGFRSALSSSLVGP